MGRSFAKKDRKRKNGTEKKKKKRPTLFCYFDERIWDVFEKITRRNGKKGK